MSFVTTEKKVAEIVTSEFTLDIPYKDWKELERLFNLLSESRNNKLQITFNFPHRFQENKILSATCIVK